MTTEPKISQISLEHRGLTLRGWECLPSDRPASRSVLLVHGFGSSDTGSYRLFVQTAVMLAASGTQSRSYSRSGHGASDGEFFDITISDEVDQVIAMIRALAADTGLPVHVVAHSLGGVESAIAAARASQDVASLTLWSPAGAVVDDITVSDAIQGEPLAPARERGYVDFNGLKLGLGFVDEVTAGLDVYAMAAGYGGPAEVMHGTADTVVPLRYGERYAEILPNCTFTAVDGADHGWSSVSWRETLFDGLRTFLSTVDSHSADDAAPSGQ